MAKESSISWTKSTFNPWIGCTRVGPGCDHCYAEALDKRMRYGGDTHWGDDKPRYRTSVKYWNDPFRWNKTQGILLDAWDHGVKLYGGDEAKCITDGFIKPAPWRVFCASLADVFDNQVPQEWRDDLWMLIEATPNLSWLLVTKRIGNALKMMPVRWCTGIPANVRLIISVVNQEEADRDIPKLLALNCKNGISYEPALGPVDWSPYLAVDGKLDFDRIPGRGEGFPYPFRGLQWIIVGGESTQGNGQARPFHIQWAKSTIEQCKRAGVPVFVKQLGSAAYFENGFLGNYLINLKDRAGANPAEWAFDLNVQEFPT